MKVGVYLYTQNWWDNERFQKYEADPSDASLGNRAADNKLFQEDLRFGELIEELGFDSIWTVEHHFSPYALSTSPLQYLSYWAGRTSRIGLGTMVIVLPWHHPVRLAEEIIALQHMLGDRELKLGFGRGIARREYGGFGIPQEESRERFAEGLEILKRAIGQERFSFEGKYFTVPDMKQRPESPHLSLRPTPLDPDRLLNNFYGAWGSPGSAPRLAAQGLKPLVIPQRAIWHYERELLDFYEAGTEAGYEPANPIGAQWVYCSNEPDAIERGVIAHDGNSASGEVNYEFGKDYHSNVAGYEQWSDYQAWVDKAAPSDATNLSDDVISGTPEQCLAKIERLNGLIHPEQLLVSFKYGNLGYEEAEKSMRLFAKEVLPAIHEMKVREPKARATATQ